MVAVCLSVLSLGIAAALYFRRQIKPGILFILCFYFLSLWVAGEVFLAHHKLIFISLVGMFVLLPISLLFAFFMDVRYGWFCFDMSYSWAVVWGFAFIFLGINLLSKAICYFFPG